MTKLGTFFDINKSTATNSIKFKRLPRQSWLKSTLKRFLNHSNNRYLEQKIHQKTTTNNLNSYRNLSQQSPNLIFHITINYLKLLLYSPSLISCQNWQKVNRVKQWTKTRFLSWTKFEDCFFKKTRLFKQKISIVFWTNERFAINLFSYVKNMQLFRQSFISAFTISMTETN